MATTITDDDFVARSSDVLSEQEAALQASYAKAVQEFARIQEKASAADSELSQNPDYSMHTVEGMGIYVVPRRTGWKALLNIIHDPVPNIDFSANIYPSFDGLLIDHFNSPRLYDPTDDHFESYESLRDNIAAVRNFLMQQYYGDPASGMTPIKAKQAMAEIAAYVGDGLYNNWIWKGIIPYHRLGEPHIDLSKARAKGGEGAQYIYEKILEKQRDSNWTRPFDAVLALFGGKTISDWKLPSGRDTHFTDFFEQDLLRAREAPPGESVEAAAARVAQIEAQLQNLRDSRALSAAAVDLDAIGNHLLFSAAHNEGVAQLNASVRRDAVDIAKDILRKLKVSIGDINLLDGLKMKPSDDLAALGAIRGVATVYERLLDWARGTGDTGIFQHPSIMAATQAIGQIGYLAKAEARRLALVAGNTVMADAITQQMKRIPAIYAQTNDRKLGELLEHIEQGMDTILNRVQQVSVNGGKVGFSVENTMGSTMEAAPTAGVQQQNGAEAAAKRNAQAQLADQLAAQAQAQRLNAQMAAAAARNQSQPGAQQQEAPAPVAQPSRGGASVGRQALANARRDQRSTTSVSANTAAPSSAIPMNAAQQQAAARQASAAAMADAARRRDEQQRNDQFQLQQRASAESAQRAAVRAAARSIDPSMLKDFKAATNAQGLAGAPITGGRNISPQAIQASMQRQAAAAQAAQNAQRPQVPAAPAQAMGQQSATTAPAVSAPRTTRPAPIANTPPPITVTQVDDPNLTNPNLLQPPQPPSRGGGRGF
jgi:hypothetical protein